MKKLTPQKVNFIYGIILLFGVIVGFSGIYWERWIRILVPIGMIIILCALVFRLLFYRCPHCGRYLDRSSGEYCPYCGKKI